MFKTTALFILTLPLAAAAQSTAKPGLYVGVRGAPDTMIQGDAFDGVTFFTSAESREVTVLPELSSATGLAVAVGWRGGRGAIEAGYARGVHRGTFDREAHRSVLSSIDLTGKAFLFKDSVVQPFVLGGFGFPWLSVEDGSATTTQLGDAVFRGGSVTAGGGVAVYVHPRVALTIGYDYRFLWLLRAKGVVSPYEELDPSVRGRMRNVTAGASFTF
jgi:hypothetical protein